MLNSEVWDKLRRYTTVWEAKRSSCKISASLKSWTLDVIQWIVPYGPLQTIVTLSQVKSSWATRRVAKCFVTTYRTETSSNEDELTAPKVRGVRLWRVSPESTPAVKVWLCKMNEWCFKIQQIPPRCPSARHLIPICISRSSSGAFSTSCGECVGGAGRLPDEMLKHGLLPQQQTSLKRFPDKKDEWGSCCCGDDVATWASTATHLRQPDQNTDGLNSWFQSARWSRRNEQHDALFHPRFCQKQRRSQQLGVWAWRRKISFLLSILHVRTRQSHYDFSAASGKKLATDADPGVPKHVSRTKNQSNSCIWTGTTWGSTFIHHVFI